jgi:hypothetical protein
LTPANPDLTLVVTAGLSIYDSCFFCGALHCTHISRISNGGFSIPHDKAAADLQSEIGDPTLAAALPRASEICEQLQRPKPNAAAI